MNVGWYSWEQSSPSTSWTVTVVVMKLHVIMLSAGVCFGGKERLHFIPDTAKVNAKLYVKTLLPEFVQDCRSVLPFLPSGFIFQQDGAPAHMTKLAQDCIATNCTEFIPNSPYLPCLGSYAWTLQVISSQAGEHRWAPESSAVDMRSAATRFDQESHSELVCESWWWTLWTYAKMNYLSDFGIFNNSQCFWTIKITSCCWLLRAELKIWHRILIQP